MLHEGIKKYVSYKVGGSSMDSEVTRRYSDFFALRAKLQERWPGVYIPNVPPKKAVGNTDIKVIDKRVRMLNLFCYKLSTLEYLFTSEEVKLFQSAGADVAKNIQCLSKLTYEKIKDKYVQSFPNYYSGYDLLLGLNRLNDFTNYLKTYQTNIRNFHESVNRNYEKKAHQIERYIQLISDFEQHEKCTLIEYIENQNEDKLVFANPQNSELNEKIRNLKDTLVNPYATLNEWLEEEESDIEAMLEALASLKGLESTKTKLQQKLESLTSGIDSFRSSGKKTFSMMFKNAESAVNEMEKEKETTVSNINYLDEIVKMASFNMEWYIERFKKEKKYEYFRHLKIFANIQKTNTSILDDLWQMVKNSMANSKDSS